MKYVALAFLTGVIVALVCVYLGNALEDLTYLMVDVLAGFEGGP